MEIEIIQQREGRWEALAMVFEGADASGFEADARLTAMWLWTLAVGKQGADDSGSGADVEDSDDEESGGKPAKLTGFVLEYDVTRKKGLARISHRSSAARPDLAALAGVLGLQSLRRTVGYDSALQSSVRPPSSASPAARDEPR